LSGLYVTRSRLSGPRNLGTERVAHRTQGCRPFGFPRLCQWPGRPISGGAAPARNQLYYSEHL